MTSGLCQTLAFRVQHLRGANLALTRFGTDTSRWTEAVESAPGRSFPVTFCIFEATGATMGEVPAATVVLYRQLLGEVDGLEAQGQGD